MTDDDHAARLREAVEALRPPLIESVQMDGGPVETYAIALDRLIRYHEAKARIAELENAQTLPCPQCNCGTVERRLANAKREIAAIIKEINDA